MGLWDKIYGIYKAQDWVVKKKKKGIHGTAKGYLRSVSTEYFCKT